MLSANKAGACRQLIVVGAYLNFSRHLGMALLLGALMTKASLSEELERSGEVRGVIATDRPTEAGGESKQLAACRT